MTTLKDSGTGWSSILRESITWLLFMFEFKSFTDNALILMCIFVRFISSFPNNYWDKFVKRKVSCLMFLVSWLHCNPHKLQDLQEISNCSSSFLFVCLFVFVASVCR